jgi:hypothetical protein
VLLRGRVFPGTIRSSPLASGHGVSVHTALASGQRSGPLDADLAT